MSDVNNASKPPGSSDNSSMIPLALSTISIVAVGGGIYYLQNEISENEKKLNLNTKNYLGYLDETILN